MVVTLRSTSVKPPVPSLERGTKAEVAGRSDDGRGEGTMHSSRNCAVRITEGKQCTAMGGGRDNLNLARSGIWLMSASHTICHQVCESLLHYVPPSLASYIRVQQPVRDEDTALLQCARPTPCLLDARSVHLADYMITAITVETCPTSVPSPWDMMRGGPAHYRTGQPGSVVNTLSSFGGW
jgi:hypothetical protein